jgi:hypothetical protein
MFSVQRFASVRPSNARIECFEFDTRLFSAENQAWVHLVTGTAQPPVNRNTHSGDLRRYAECSVANDSEIAGDYHGAHKAMIAHGFPRRMAKTSLPDSAVRSSPTAKAA